MKKKAKATPITLAPSKPYTPAPHPQQTRIDAIRVIPSLVTTNPHFTPRGK
jgi:hypothetical protein